jgi:hypothetical protein
MLLNALLNNFTIPDDRKGFLFENLFFNQLQTSLSYSDQDYRLSTYKTNARTGDHHSRPIDDAEIFLWQKFLEKLEIQIQ